jgi:hypothetical protein
MQKRGALPSLTVPTLAVFNVTKEENTNHVNKQSITGVVQCNELKGNEVTGIAGSYGTRTGGITR